MRKTYSQYIEYIKLMLGVVDDNEDSLELSNESLTRYVKLAFLEIKPYINIRKRATLKWNNGFNGAVDLKSCGIRAQNVITVRRGQAQGYINGGTNLSGSWSSFSYTTNGTYPDVPLYAVGGSAVGGSMFGISAGGNYSSDAWLTEKFILKGINETSGDRHFLFDYDTQLLFINFNTATPNTVTIDYIPDYENAEQIDDSFWVNIIQKKSLALTKLGLSQYRGKFSSVAGSPFVLDYQRLQSEGEALNREVETILEENSIDYIFD